MKHKRTAYKMLKELSHTLYGTTGMIGVLLDIPKDTVVFVDEYGHRLTYSLDYVERMEDMGWVKRILVELDGPEIGLLTFKMEKKQS